MRILLLICLSISLPTAAIEVTFKYQEQTAVFNFSNEVTIDEVEMSASETFNLPQEQLILSFKQGQLNNQLILADYQFSESIELRVNQILPVLNSNNYDLIPLDLETGRGGSDVPNRLFTESDSGLYYVAKTETHGLAIFYFDWITRLNSLIFHQSNDPQNTTIKYLTLFDNNLYFAASDANSPTKMSIWRYMSQTQSASVLINSVSANITDFAIYQNAIYYSGQAYEFWFYNLETEINQLVKNVSPYIAEHSKINNPKDFKVHNNILYFRTSAVNGWGDTSDIESGSTIMSFSYSAGVKMVAANNRSHIPVGYEVIDDGVFFNAEFDRGCFSEVEINELSWPTSDYCYGPNKLFKGDNTIYFAKFSDTYGDYSNYIEIWQYKQGDVNYVIHGDDIFNGGNDYPILNSMLTLNNDVFFAASNGIYQHNDNLTLIHPETSTTQLSTFQQGLALISETALQSLDLSSGQATDVLLFNDGYRLVSTTELDSASSNQDKLYVSAELLWQGNNLGQELLMVLPQGTQRTKVKAIKSISLVAGQIKILRVSAINADKEQLLYSLEYAPNWLSIDELTGIIEIAPPSDTVKQTSDVEVAITQGESKVSQFFSIEVQPYTQPTIKSIDNLSIQVTETIKVPLIIEATETRPYDTEVTGLPRWLTFNEQEREITGTAPSYETTQSFTINVSVDDGISIVSTQFTIDIQVSAQEKEKTLSGGSVGWLALACMATLIMIRKRKKLKSRIMSQQAQT